MSGLRSPDIPAITRAPEFDLLRTQAPPPVINHFRQPHPSHEGTPGALPEHLEQRRTSLSDTPPTNS